MNLNAFILFDNLQNYHLESSALESSDIYQRDLRFPVLYDRESLFLSDRVYIARAEDLTPEPSFRQNSVILCIGTPDRIYSEAKCNLLCFNQNVRVSSLLNKTIEIFEKYATWDETLRKLLMDNAPLKEYGNASLKIFGNPVSLHDRNHRAIFTSVDEYNVPLPEDAVMEDNSYMPTEEINLLMSDPEYNELYKKREPVLFSDKLYDYKSLLNNLFEGDEFLGRTCLYNIYRPFRTSDYTLLAHFSEYIRSALRRKEMINEINPYTLEAAISQCIRNGVYDEMVFERALAAQGWNSSDTYLCLNYTLPEISVLDNEELASFGPEINRCSATSRDNDSLLLVCNLTQGGLAYADAASAFRRFCMNNGSTGGISMEFSGLEKLTLYYQQAVLARKKASASGHGNIVRFDDIQLEYLCRAICRETDPEMYIPAGLQRLRDYDRLNDSDYCELLRVFLDNNMNIAETIRILYIHRNTFLYRISRIKDIMGSDLKDPEERLSIQLAFLISEIGG